MNKNDAYATLKLESSSIAGKVVCVCGMPNGPASVYGREFSNCDSCGAVMRVDSHLELHDPELRPALAHEPGFVIDFDQSDLFMVLYCICGYQTQNLGTGKHEVSCAVCRLTYCVGPRLRVESVTIGQRANPDDTLRIRSTSWPSPEGAAQEQDDLPDVTEKVAAFMRNPFSFWQQVWKKADL